MSKKDEYEVRTIRLDCSKIQHRFEYKKIDLDIEFQSRIIESLLYNNPIKKIVIHDDERSIEKVIHGSEIIQTINDFYNNKFLFTPTIFKTIEPNYFLNMPRSIQRRLGQANIDFIVLSTWKKDVDITKIMKLLESTAF